MSAPGYTINVSGLAPETTTEKLHDFFSFCGKLLSVKKEGSTAEITFEKLSAMRTSLMLNGGTLDGAHLEVTSAADSEPKTASVLPTGVTGSAPIGAGITEPLSQEDKPKAAIVAEYIAHGYVLGDNIIERFIEFDQKQGISSRFLNFFNSIDHTVGSKLVGENHTVSEKINEQATFVVNKTKEVDQNRGVSARFNAYFNKALDTTVGQKVHRFYTDTSKQVLDVHEEARRIADVKKANSPATATTVPSTTATSSTDAKAPLSTSEVAPTPASAGVNSMLGANAPVFP